MAVIGVDFDGTLAAYDGWKGPRAVGQPNKRLVQILHNLLLDGHILCTWTCRSDSVVKRYLSEHKLTYLFAHINSSPYPTETAKASFDLLIDDISVRWTGNETYADLAALVADKAVMDADVSRDIDYSDRNPKLFYQGTGDMFIDHFEDLWKPLWENIEPQRIAFLTICAHAKPYSKSSVHSRMREQLWREGVLSDLTYVHLSGAGLIPSEREMVYPFNAYDGNMAEATDSARAYLRSTLTRRMGEWLAEFSQPYEKIVIYLRESGNTMQAVQEFYAQNPDPRIVILTAKELPALPWQPDADPDDCLYQGCNFNRVIDAIQGFLL